MIYLDGNWYETVGESEQTRTGTFSTHARTETGTLIVTQAPVVNNARGYQLVLTKAQLLRLRDTVAKTGALDFVDHENFGWHPGAGTDSATNAYGTGVFFAPNFELIGRPQEGNGWHDCNRWLAEVQLIVAARGLDSGEEGSSSVDLVQEIPAGTINGVNVTFTVSQTPNDLILFKNGVAQTQSVDYTISGSTITYLAGAIPQTGDTHLAVYTTL